MPKVSVIIPCYNMGQYLEEAVSSVLAQSFSDFEILVVDDGSSDHFTSELLKDYSRPKTKVIHTENRGVAAARNRGIIESQGEYILPLDADDRIMPRYLEQAVDVLESKSEVGIVYGIAEFFGERSGLMPLPLPSPSRLLWKNCIFSSAIFRKFDWEKVGGYSPKMRYGWEDWDFWLSLVGSGVEVVRLSDVVLQYRIRSDSRDRTMSLYKKGMMLGTMIARRPKVYMRRGLLGLMELIMR